MSNPSRTSELSADVPRPGPVPPLRVGRPTRATLANGLDAMVVARPSVPRVEVRLTVPAGAAIGPNAATSELLRAGILLGTKALNQEEVSEAIQRLGGSLQIQQDHDRMHIAASALAEAEEELYRLVCTVITEPAFPADDLETERVKLIEGLRTARATPQFLAGERLQHLIYGSHPYGRPEPAEAAIKKTTRGQLADLHRATFLPSAAQITVVGDVEPRRTVTRLRRAFASWSGPRKSAKVPQVHPQSRPEITFIDRPGLVQTVILLGTSAPPVGHPDQIPLTLASAVLGGSFSSRLMANLREDKGYTYSPHTMSEAHLRDSLLGAALDVRTEVTAAAHVEVMYELGRLATVEVEPAELEESRNYLAGVRVIFLQTQAGLASSLAQVRGYGLDHRYLEGYSDRLAAVSPADLRRVAARYLSPANLTTVMVGDAAAAADDLARVFPVKVKRSGRGANH
ncbi:MAG TPA: pitrilysin family protein [Candidatus Dormibacteraeota bacterium]|nr:pitrilysin family protein [Candidatus Dormibacteraeota bacterium]